MIEINGTKQYSEYSSVVSKQVKIGVPSGLRAERLDSGSALVIFEEVRGAYGYEVYRSTSLDGKYTGVASIETTYYGDTGLSNKDYYYKVRAYCLVGKTKVYGAYSDVVVCLK